MKNYKEKKIEINYQYFYTILLILKSVLTLFLVTSYPDSFIYQDSNTYIVPAKNLWFRGEFWNELGPEIFRTPGYSLMLAPSFALSNSVIFYAAFSQLILNFGIAYFTFKIACNITNKKSTGHLAAILVLICPEITISQYAILSEMLFTFLLIASVYLCLSWMCSGLIVEITLSFLLLTAASFVRPISIYLPYIVTIIAFFMISKKKYNQSTKYACIAILICLSTHTLLIMAWQSRNMNVSGVNEFSTVQSVNMNEYIAAAIESAGSNSDWEMVREFRKREYYSAPASERSKIALGAFIDSIQNYPTAAVKIFSKGLFAVAVDPGVGDWLNFFKLRQSNSGIIYKYINMSPFEFLNYLFDNEKLLLIITFIGILYVSLIWLTFFRGVYKIEKSVGVILLLIVIVYFLITSAGPQSMSRLRVPVMPLIIVFSVIGLTSCSKLTIKKIKYRLKKEEFK